MKGIKFSVATAAIALALAINSFVAQAQSEVTQTFTLRPGWNAIFLEVQPQPRDPAAVFAGLDDPDSDSVDLESVWTWLSRESTAEFIQDPSEGLYGQPGWHAYFNVPDDDFRSNLTNLYAVLGSQAYLIKIKDDAAEFTWEITGIPSMRKFRWLADSFNMVGFQVDPTAPPSFAAFFAPSPAHAGQAVYRLNNLSGRWEFVPNPAAVNLKSGEAYWVYCEGSSTYQGPLRVDLPMSAGLLSGSALTRHTVTLTNLSYVTRTVNFALSGEVVLYYREWDVANGYFLWRPLNEMPAMSLQPERSRNVWLEVRRELMDPGLSESLLEIRDDQGIRIRVPVSVEKIQ
jgi:hypothetical protein